MIVFDRQKSLDAPAIEALLDRAFGPDRHLKTCQRLRDGRRPAEGLAFVARDRTPRGRRLVGTLTFWNVTCGEAPALMLGPLAVDPDYRSMGIGKGLIRRGLDAARRLGHRAVILVGDAPYYAPFGFERAFTTDLVLPGPVDEARFLGLELEPGALLGAAGLVRATGRLAPPAALAVPRAA